MRRRERERQCGQDEVTKKRKCDAQQYKTQYSSSMRVRVIREGRGSDRMANSNYKDRRQLREKETW